jgi:hypothetical protein
LISDLFSFPGLAEPRSLYFLAPLFREEVKKQPFLFAGPALAHSSFTIRN